MLNIYSYSDYIKESKNIETPGKLFIDLTPDEQNRALEKNYDIAIYDDWYEEIIEIFEEELLEFGISQVECKFSGFYSQGDGASFTADDIDTELFLTKAMGLGENQYIEFSDKYKKYDTELVNLLSNLRDLGFSGERIDPQYIYINFRRDSSRYCHENTVYVDIESDGHPDGWDNDMSRKFDKYLMKLSDDINEWRKEKCRELYSLLEKEYDSLLSEKEVKETLIANDYIISPETGDII